MSQLQLASFTFDVTPPVGHSICGGWIPPVSSISDTLECVGIVLLGAGAPIVICAVDWLGLLNNAHLEFRQALSEGAGTTPDRVTVHCVHQHSAPLICLETQELVAAAGGLADIVKIDFFEDCLTRGRQTIAAALSGARPVTHVANGQARVVAAASNRRIHRDAAGNVIANRRSWAPAYLRELPEGLIDPWLKTVAFYDGDTRIAVCHYYASHPQSHYGDGIVNSDTVGLARKRRQEADPACRHLYFTGCAGNVAFGKYNDGAAENRTILSQRIYEGMLASEVKLQPCRIDKVTWQTLESAPPPLRADLSVETLRAVLENRECAAIERGHAAFMLAWHARVQHGTPLALNCLWVNDTALVHLPAECFVEYQLRAQAMRPDAFVAVAAYGDGGPWYIPVAEEYGKGGYELDMTFCDSDVDEQLTRGMKTLLTSAVS